MKINLVSDITYYPARTGKNNPAANKTISGTRRTEAAGQFGKVLMEELCPTEATAIKKLFGDFNPASSSKLDPGSSNETRPGNIPRGQFVDITV